METYNCLKQRGGRQKKRNPIVLLGSSTFFSLFFYPVVFVLQRIKWLDWDISLHHTGSDGPSSCVVCVCVCLYALPALNLLK